MKTTQKTLLGLVLISPLLFSNFVMAEVSWVDLDADSTEYKWAYTTGDQDGIHFPITPANLRAPAGYLIILRGNGSSIYPTNLQKIPDVNTYMNTLPDCSAGAGCGGLFYRLSNGHLWDYWATDFMAYAVPGLKNLNERVTNLEENPVVGTHTHDGDNSGISPEQAAAIQANTAALEEGVMELDDQEDRIFLLESQLAVKTDQITTLQTTLEGLTATVAQLSDTATIQDLEQQVADLSERPTLEQVRDGRPGSVLLSVDSEAGSVALNFTVEESEDLITWTPVEGAGVSQTLTLPEGKRFYRFAH